MKYFIAACLSFLLLGPAGAQTLGLKDAINIALKNSLEIQLTKNTLDINTTYNNLGVAGGLPLVTGTFTDNEQNTSVNQKLNNGSVTNRSGVSANNLNGGVTAGILLYNGLRVVATKKRLEQLQAQSAKLVNSQIQNTMASVMTGYFDVVRHQNYLATLDHSIEVAQKKLDIIKAQQSVGMANNADLFQAQLDLNALIQSKITQQLVTSQAKTELLRILGLKQDSSIQISDSIRVDQQISLDSVVSRVRANPEISAADDQIRINELIVKETAAQRYPSVRASTGFNYTRSQAAAGTFLLNQSYGPFVGLSLNIPIYNGSIYKRQVKVAQINIANARLQKDILVRDYTSGAVKTYQSYSSALQQLETQQQNLQLAQQLLDLILQKFQYRQATIIDVKQAQQSFENASYTYINLSYAAKAAEIELKRLTSSLNF